MKHLEAGQVSPPKQRRIGALLIVCVLLATIPLVPQLRSLADTRAVHIANVTYVGHDDATR
ncbi:hypothetical protein FS749_008479, partial [Ceratobasidium sp. UAMH 11750]